MQLGPYSFVDWTDIKGSNPCLTFIFNVTVSKLESVKTIKTEKKSVDS